MAMSEYRGAAGVARKVTKEYRGVAGVARNVIKAYRGVAGVARQYFTYGLTFKFSTGIHASNGVTNNITLNDSFAGVEGKTWRFYVNATNSAASSDDNRAYANVVLSNYDFVGKTLSLTYQGYGKDAYLDYYVQFNGAASGSNHEVFRGVAGQKSTDEFTIPEGTKYVTLGVNCGAKGTRSIELIVYALSIGDEVIL